MSDRLGQPSVSAPSYTAFARALGRHDRSKLLAIVTKFSTDWSYGKRPAADVLDSWLDGVETPTSEVAQQLADLLGDLQVDLAVEPTAAPDPRSTEIDLRSDAPAGDTANQGSGSKDSGSDADVLFVWNRIEPLPALAIEPDSEGLASVLHSLPSEQEFQELRESAAATVAKIQKISDAS